MKNARKFKKYLQKEVKKVYEGIVQENYGGAKMQGKAFSKRLSVKKYKQCVKTLPFFAICGMIK